LAEKKTRLKTSKKKNSVFIIFRFFILVFCCNFRLVKF